MLAVMAVAPVLAAPPSGASSTADSPNAKVELLYHVAKFIDWPARKTTEVEEEFTFAILGQDELATVLATAWSTKTVQGRPVFVRCVRRPQDARDCQMLFIAASEEKRVAEVLTALEGTSVLTVADVPSFASRGGMVNFLDDQGRVSFEINPENARRAGLKISAKLLALARIVDAE